jgi:hypothetical protein
MLTTIIYFIFSSFHYSFDHQETIYFFSYRYLPVDVDTKVPTTSQQCKNGNMSTDGVFDLVCRGLIGRFNYGNHDNNDNRGNNRNKGVGSGNNKIIDSATTY